MRLGWSSVRAAVRTLLHVSSPKTYVSVRISGQYFESISYVCACYMPQPFTECGGPFCV